MKALKILLAALLIVTFVSVGANAQTWTNYLHASAGSDEDWSDLLTGPPSAQTHTVSHTVDATEVVNCVGDACVISGVNYYAYVCAQTGQSSSIMTGLSDTICHGQWYMTLSTGTYPWSGYIYYEIIIQ